VIYGLGFVFKAVVIALVAIFLGWVVSVFAFFLNRRTISVRPLTVSNGDGFDGQHFVAIAIHTHHRMRGLNVSGAALPGVSAAAPRMMMDNATSAASDVVAGLASEQAGKVMAALLSIIRRPRYICCGSIHFGVRQAHIVVRLERGDQVVEVWERSLPASRLVEDLKDLTFLALQAASSKIRKRWI
jgi:hypothetical protein